MRAWRGHDHPTRVGRVDATIGEDPGRASSDRAVDERTRTTGAWSTMTRRIGWDERSLSKKASTAALAISNRGDRRVGGWGPHGFDAPDIGEGDHRHVVRKDHAALVPFCDCSERRVDLRHHEGGQPFLLAEYRSIPFWPSIPVYPKLVIQSGRGIIPRRAWPL